MPKMPKIIQGKFKILSNQKKGLEHYQIKIKAPGIAQQACPGQFAHLLCTDTTEPLLRRPFSFHRLGEDSFELLYEVIGAGTKLLAKKRKGDTIDLIGPLGNGFPILQPTTYNLRPILIAGGMGVAPLLALAEKLKAQNPLILLGARSKKHLFCVNEFKKLGLKLRIATDDGSSGHHGFVTELLEDFLLHTTYDILYTIYSCGPKAMLKQVAKIAKLKKVPCYVSLEEKMACGLGACLGCAVKTRTGYQRVCKEGPVFDAQNIIW